MIFPSLSSLRNIIAEKSQGLLGAWEFVNHDTQNSVCSFDSFVSFVYDKKNPIVEYPIEEGSFTTYNKQREPFSITLVLSKSGLSLAFERKKFLDTLEEYCDGTSTVDVITPSKTYLNCSLGEITYKYMPQENPDILLVQLTIKEIIELSSITLTNQQSSVAKQPWQTNSASTQQLGLKEAQTV